MKASRIAFVLLAVLVVGAVLFWGVGRQPTQEESGSQSPSSQVVRPSTLAIGAFAKAFSYAPLYVAQHFKWFDTADRTVKFTEFNDRPAISAAITGGQLDLLFSAEVPAIITEAQGNDLEMWALTSSSVQKVLVRTDSPLTSPAQLKGKKVAVLQSTSSHYGLLKLLAEAGLKESDLAIAYMPPPEARAAFESRQLDGWAVWAPFVEEQEVRGNGREIGGEGALIHSVMTVPVGRLREEPNLGRDARAVLRKAQEWMSDNPEQAQPIVATAMGLDLKVVQRAWTKFNWMPPIDSAFVQDLQEKADFLAAADKTRASRRVDVRKEFVAGAIVQGIQ